MAIVTVKYVRKPLYVDAVKITPDNFAEISRWCQGEVRENGNDLIVPDNDIDPSKNYIRVRVHNPKNVRQTKAIVGDWLLYTDRGYKVYTERAFFGSFDPVNNARTAPAAPALDDPMFVDDASDVGEVQQ